MCLDAISRGAALGLWLAVWLPATWAEPAQHCQPQSRESSSRGKGELCQNIISPRPCREGPVLSRSRHCAEVLSLSSACCCCLRKAFAKSWSPASAGAVSGSIRDRNIAVLSQGLGTGLGVPSTSVCLMAITHPAVPSDTGLQMQAELRRWSFLFPLEQHQTEVRSPASVLGTRWCCGHGRAGL